MADKPTFEECVAEMREAMATNRNAGFPMAVRMQAAYGYPSDQLMKEAVKPAPVKPFTAADMPAPDQLLDYGNGWFEAAMFHYSGEGSNYSDMAKANGFEVDYLALEDDDTDEGLLLQAKYERGGDGLQLAIQWQPAVPEGWTLGAKYDTEDGLTALFLKRKE